MSRLERGEVQPGDDIFKIVIARGVPSRVIWDNDFEVLLYKSGVALIFQSGVFAHAAECLGCATKYDRAVPEGISDAEVAKALGLKRPKY